MIFWGKSYRNNLIQHPKLIIKKEVYDFIVKVTKESPDSETGGILIGFDNEPMTINVSCATLPGVNSIRERTRFIRDTSFCRKVLTERFEKYGEDYVGEWHSHVVNLRQMSFGDINTISSIIHDKDYNFKVFACIVANLCGEEVELIGYIASKAKIHKVIIEIDE